MWLVDPQRRIRLLLAAAALGAGLAAVVALLYRPQALVRWIHRRTDDDIYFRVETSRPVMALTIDDGPHPDVTPQILDLLAAYDARATFFLLGDRIPGNEALVARIVADGHELGNHLMSDNRSITLTDDAFNRELAEAHALLSAYGPLRWFRPGSGWFNRRMLSRIRRYGYETVLGSVYPYDAQHTHTQFMISYILGNVAPGGIIVLHDGTERRRQTITVLEEVLPALAGRGYRLVSLSQLAAIGARPA